MRLMRECRFLCVFLALFAISSAPDAADEPSAELRPDSTIDVALTAGSTSEFIVDLPPGTAADLRLVQRSGSIDLRLIDATTRMDGAYTHNAKIWPARRVKPQT